MVQHTNDTRELRIVKWGFVPFFMDGKPVASGPKLATPHRTSAPSRRI